MDMVIAEVLEAYLKAAKFLGEDKRIRRLYNRKDAEEMAEK